MKKIILSLAFAVGTLASAHATEVKPVMHNAKTTHKVVPHKVVLHKHHKKYAKAHKTTHVTAHKMAPKKRKIQHVAAHKMSKAK